MITPVDSTALGGNAVQQTPTTALGGAIFMGPDAPNTVLRGSLKAPAVPGVLPPVAISAPTQHVVKTTAGHCILAANGFALAVMQVRGWRMLAASIIAHAGCEHHRVCLLPSAAEVCGVC